MKMLFTSVGRPRIDTANGVELEIYRTAETLASMGHDVLIACLTPLSAWPVPGVDVKAFAPSRIAFSVPGDMKEAISEWQPDVAVISSVYTPFNTRFAAWCRSKSLNYVIRPCGGLGLLNERLRRWKKRPYKLFFELPMLNQALFIWAGGDEADIRSYGTTAPIVVTPRGLDIPAIRQRNRFDVKALEGLEDKFVFGFVGRLDPIHKGLDLAIEGFHRLRAPDTALVLVGPVNSEIERQFAGFILKRPGSERIRLAGPLFRDDRDRFLGAIDAFIHTSRWEGGVPLSVIEAAAMATPLLLTRQADPAEMLKKSGGCVQVQLDPDSIAGGMRKLIEMPTAERRAMGDNAARSVESEFGWMKMAQGLVNGLRDHGVA